ncbi:Transcription initiation factor IIF subunit beta [Psidium guajava]|nr:Transcription initiation factor IIF subunit beta [Psidium guajava]
MSQPNTPESYRCLLNIGEEEFEAMFGIEPMKPGLSVNEVQDLSKDKDNNGNGQKKRYRRHTKEQVQRLEDFFSTCHMPNGKQKMELSQELGLEPSQIKFWFQNRRTRMKTRHDHNEAKFLRVENENLRAENKMYKEAFDSATCSNCNSLLLTFDEMHDLRIENAHLRGELDQFITGSSSIGRGYKRTNVTGSSSIPLKEKGTNHHQADIGDDLFAIIN